MAMVNEREREREVGSQFYTAPKIFYESSFDISLIL